MRQPLPEMCIFAPTFRFFLTVRPIALRCEGS